MKRILILLAFLPFLLQAQTDATIDKGSGWLYFSGIPGTTPSVAAGSEVAINTLTKEAYIWNRDSSAWQPWLLVDSLTYSADTLRIYQNGSATALTAVLTPDGNGLFSASNNNDTIRVSTALLRAALNISGGANGISVSSSSVPLSAVSLNGVSGWFTSSNSATATYMNVLDVSRVTTGTAAAGLGARIRYVLEASNGGTTNAGYLGIRWTDPDVATAATAFDVRLLDGGAEATRLTLLPTGQLTLPGYAASALTSTDSSIYVVTTDETGDVWKIPIDSVGGTGSADGNGIYTGSGTVPSNAKATLTNYFAIVPPAAGSFEGVYFYDNETYIKHIGPDGTLYLDIDGGSNPYFNFGFGAGSPMVNIDLAANETYMQSDSVQIRLIDDIEIKSVNTGFSYKLAKSNPSTTSADTSFMVWIGNGSTASPSFIEMASISGGGADQTLSVSNDSLTISGTGNTVKVPGTLYVRDSVTTTTLTVDLKEANSAFVSIKMTSATNLTLTIDNAFGELTDATAPTYEGWTGIYTFRFWDISGTDNVTWPAAFLDMNGTALGTDALTSGTAYTCQYDPVEAKFYCK